jgi:glycosyltransferase involved in cell wall biosynthesis
MSDARRDPNLLHVMADGAPGGGPTMVLGLIDDLVASVGWRPAVMSQPGSHLARETLRRGLPFLPFDFFGPISDPRMPFRLARMLRGLGRPLTHVHGLRAAHPLLCWPARRELGPVVYTVHGVHQLHMRWSRVQRELANGAERRVIRRADRTVYVSRGDLELSLKHRLVAEPARAEVIHNGVSFDELPDLEGAAPSHDVVFAARLVEQKAPLVAAGVLARLAARGLRCAMAGGGPLARDCEALLRSTPGGNAVRVLGELSRRQCLELVASSRLMLMTSRWEGLPIAPVESMALGVPVVAPAIDGLSEVVVDGECGLLLRSPGIDDYADAVEALLADPVRLADLSTRCVTRARGSFDRSVSSSRYAALYDGMLQAVPAGRARVAGGDA